MADSKWYISFLNLFHSADYQSGDKEENEADEDHHVVINNPCEEHIYIKRKL